MNNLTLQNDQELFADNAAPFNTIKLISAGSEYVKKHIVDIAAQTVQKESQLNKFKQKLNKLKQTKIKGQQIQVNKDKSSTKSVIIVKQEQCEINSIAMSNDTHTLFVADDNGIMQFQKEDSSLNYFPVRNLKVHTYSIFSISLSNSKMHLLSASRDKALRVWDLENGTQLACLNEEGKEHDNYNIFNCCWNDQDTLFASGDWNCGVVVWSPPLSIYNTSNQFIAKCKFKAEGDDSSILCLKFQENGLDLFASYSSLFPNISITRLWSINEKELLDSKSAHQQNATLPLIQQPQQELEYLNLHVLSFDVRGSMFVVGVESQILQLSANSLQSMADAVEFEQVHDHLITSLVFSKDGKYVASGSADKSVAIFDSKSGKCAIQIEDAHNGCVNTVVFQI